MFRLKYRSYKTQRGSLTWKLEGEKKIEIPRMPLLPLLFIHSGIRLHSITLNCTLNFITHIILLLKSLHVFHRSLKRKCDVTFRDKAVYYSKEYTS